MFMSANIVIPYKWSNQIISVRRPMHSRKRTSNAPLSTLPVKGHPINNTKSIHLWVYEAADPYDSYVFPHLFWSYSSVFGVFFYQCVHTCIEVEKGSVMDLNVVEYESKEESTPIKIYLQGKRLWGTSDIKIFFLSFFFWRTTVKHPGVSHCPHLCKQPRPVADFPACLGVARLA